jgi:hypothetical protein
MAQPPVPDPAYEPGGTVPAGPPRRGWWGRNWFWVVPVGCLVPLVCCCGGPALIGVGVMSGLKQSDPYKDAVARAKQSQAVQDALGTPLQEGWLVQGNLNVSDGSGTADLTIPLSGPKGSGSLHVVGTRAANQWTYSTMAVDVPGSGAHLDLLADVKGP